ncbi:MAG: hypothetical protein IJI46_08510 [Erysipelotrichaceae bacterium]|nr:hypothetical protein [Erysipelotrichaceae bacterium]
MSPYVILMLAVIILTLALSYYLSNRGKANGEKLAALLAKGDFKTFDAYCQDEKFVKQIQPFTLDYLKLNSYLLRSDKKKTEAVFEKLQKANLNRDQRRDVALKGFAYYLGLDDKQNTKYYLEEMEKTLVSEDILNNSRMYYDIIYEKKTDMLDSLLEECEQLEGEERAGNEQLIAIIYKNLGDDKKAREYERRSRKDLGIKGEKK